MKTEFDLLQGLFRNQFATFNIYVLKQILKLLKHFYKTLEKN